MRLPKGLKVCIAAPTLYGISVSRRGEIEPGKVSLTSYAFVKLSFRADLVLHARDARHSSDTALLIISGLLDARNPNGHLATNTVSNRKILSVFVRECRRDFSRSNQPRDYFSPSRPAR